MKKWFVSGLAGSALALVVAGGALADSIPLVDGGRGSGSSTIVQDPDVTSPHVEKVTWISETRIWDATPNRWIIEVSGVGKVPNNPSIPDCIIHTTFEEVADTRGEVKSDCIRHNVGRFETLTIRSEHYFDDKRNVRDDSFTTQGQA
ncbi:MAG: hypothetical protein MI924_17935 [Chloroflexales bacterium]|nr:hypothetical protein [Chloroflexales bacterium]